MGEIQTIINDMPDRSTLVKIVVALIVILTILITVCVIIVSKLYFDSSKGSVDILSALSSIATIVGTIFTIAALSIAYSAFENQISSNEFSISSTTANALLSNISSVRNALSLVYYEKNDGTGQLEYGARAANMFVEDFQVPVGERPADHNEVLRRLNIPAKGLISEVTNQLEIIYSVIEDVEQRKRDLRPTDLKQVDNALRALISYYVKNFELIFFKTRSAVNNLDMQMNDWRLDMIEFIADILEKHYGLIQKLVDKKYLAYESVFRNMTAMQMAARMSTGHTVFMWRISRIPDTVLVKAI
jgi:hypothetical protein